MQFSFLTFLKMHSVHLAEKFMMLGLCKLACHLPHTSSYCSISMWAWSTTGWGEMMKHVILQIPPPKTDLYCFLHALKTKINNFSPVFFCLLTCKCSKLFVSINLSYSGLKVTCALVSQNQLVSQSILNLPCFTQNKGKESENSYKKLERSL